MKPDTKNLRPNALSRATAAAATTATFAKSFVPFYLIGSTAIFVAASALGVCLIAYGWRAIYGLSRYVNDILIVLPMFYGTIVVIFFAYSYPTVPITHLFGILIFHALFIVFGFAAARSLNAVLILLLSAAAVYGVVIVQHVIRFGNLMEYGYFPDIFGVKDPYVFFTFHQNIGMSAGMAALAALGLSSRRTKRNLALGALPFVLLFLFYISARGALVALVCSLLFLVANALWVRSRKLVVFAVIAAVIMTAVASGWFYQLALVDKNVDPKAGDAISRTIREIQDPNPGFRIQIWTRTVQRILAEPDRLVFGRGIGMFPVNDGFGAPDWLLRKAEGSTHYPHNLQLELLYETGIVGLLLFTFIAIYPLGAALRRWSLLSSAERSVIALYVFNLAGTGFSGAFAYSYSLQFFFGLSVGIIAMKRLEDPAIPNPRRLEMA